MGPEVAAVANRLLLDNAPADAAPLLVLGLGPADSAVHAMVPPEPGLPPHFEEVGCFVFGGGVAKGVSSMSGVPDGWGRGVCKREAGRRPLWVAQAIS
jgi:hypothetical protein